MILHLLANNNKNRLWSGP